MCNFPFKISPKRKWKIQKENEKSKKKMKNPRRKWKIQKEIEKSSCIHDFYYFRSFVLVCSTMQTVSCMEHVIQCTHLLKTINIYKYKLKYKCLLTSKQIWTFDYYYWQRNLNFSRLYPKHTSIHNLTITNRLHMSAFTCSRSPMKTPEHWVKFLQTDNKDIKTMSCDWIWIYKIY